MRYLALLLLAACSSSDGLQKNMIEGGPGQAINVYVAGVDNSGFMEDHEGSRQYVIHFEVSNNLDVPVTVEKITLRPSNRVAFQVATTSQPFNEMIDPGGEHIFDVNARGRFVRPLNAQESRRTEFQCIVTLTNGDSYLYLFEGPVVEDFPGRRP